MGLIRISVSGAVTPVLSLGVDLASGAMSMLMLMLRSAIERMVSGGTYFRLHVRTHSAPPASGQWSRVT
eukprot:m.20468 g.20468  ORF g.20468 m.20468 type:complete len:69 (+) comp10217_c0_seq1:581-787(+)